jgi:hypothetical protein
MIGRVERIDEDQKYGFIRKNKSKMRLFFKIADAKVSDPPVRVGDFAFFEQADDFEKALMSGRLKDLSIGSHRNPHYRGKFIDNEAPRAAKVEVRRWQENAVNYSG